MLRFEWDQAKDEANRRKHGVSFEEAITAFYDEFARIIFDPDHSQDEDRFVLMGMSIRSRLLVVCQCYREDDRVIRMFSARKANTEETREYQRLKS
jgi:uncharacterized DUF497 family protein